MADKKAFLLRIPQPLWEDVNRWAQEELRSVNAQIEFILRQATRQRRRDKEKAAGSSPPDTPSP